MTDFRDNFNLINSCITKKDGERLSSLLAIPFPNLQSSTMISMMQSMERINIMAYCQSNIHVNEKVGTFIGHVQSALFNLVKKNYDEAFQQQHSAYEVLTEYFFDINENSSWLFHCFCRVMNDLRLIAEISDRESRSDHKNLRECIPSVNQAFTSVMRDKIPVSDPNSRKISIFAITNALFKIYFKLNTLQSCGKLINIVEGPANVMNTLRSFRVSDVVMYKYYIGRLKMFEDKFEESRECLRFALRYCPKQYLQNRKRILASLLPVEMSLGVMPTELIAKQYGLHELWNIGKAIICGDLKSFDHTMITRQKTFIKLGVYLVLEQCKVIAYRNLVKRIACISGTLNPKVNLLIMEKIFQWLGEDVDLDEIECILSNLIFKGQVKGYLSHQKRFLIVSKADPFPVNTVIKKMKKED